MGRAEKLAQAAEQVGEQGEGNETFERYHERHDTQTCQILTIYDAHHAARIVDRFAARISGRVVIEVGAGCGFVALAMARYARHVYAIDIDPGFTWAFMETVYETKPTNLTWIFGRAQDMQPHLRGDVAVCFTRSDAQRMRKLCAGFAPDVIWGTDYLDGGK